MEKITPINLTKTHIVGLSTEEKPINQHDGTTFLEVDTCKLFIYYKNFWYEQFSPDKEIILSDIIRNTRIHITDAIKRPFSILKFPDDETIYINNRNFLTNNGKKTFSDNGVTIDSYEDGNYHVYGTPTAVFNISIDIPETYILKNSYIHLRNAGIETARVALNLRDGTSIKASPSFLTENRIVSLNLANDTKINNIKFFCNDQMIGEEIDFWCHPSIELTNEITDYIAKEIQTITNFNKNEAYSYNGETTIYSIDDDFEIEAQYYKEETINQNRNIENKRKTNEIEERKIIDE